MLITFCSALIYEISTRDPIPFLRWKCHVFYTCFLLSFLCSYVRCFFGRIGRMDIALAIPRLVVAGRFYTRIRIGKCTVRVLPRFFPLLQIPILMMSPKAVIRLACSKGRVHMCRRSCKLRLSCRTLTFQQVSCYLMEKFNGRTLRDLNLSGRIASKFDFKVQIY